MPRLELVLMLLAGILIGGAAGAIGTMKYLDFASGAASMAFVMQADQARRKGDLAGAEILAYDVIAANPQHHTGYILLADILEQRGQVEAARSCLERALLYVRARSGNSTSLTEYDENSWRAQQLVLERTIAALSTRKEATIEQVAAPP